MIVNAGPLFDILTELPNFIDVQDGEIKELFLAIIEAYNAGDAENEILMQSHIFKLVYLLNRITAGERKRHSPKSNNREIIEKTVEYINNNLLEFPLILPFRGYVDIDKKITALGGNIEIIED
mgnify:CR=1 FL=1